MMATDAPRIDVRRLGKWADGCLAHNDDQISGRCWWNGLLMRVEVESRCSIVGPWHIDPDHYTTGPLLLAAVCEELALSWQWHTAVTLKREPRDGTYWASIGHKDGSRSFKLPAGVVPTWWGEALLWVADKVLQEVSDG